MRLKKIIEAKPDNIDLDGYDRIRPGFRKTILKSVKKEVERLQYYAGCGAKQDEILAKAWRNVERDMAQAWRKLLKQERERWEEQGKLLDRFENEIGGYAPYNPNYAVSPGEILQDHLEQHGLSRAGAARRMGVSVYEIGRILDGITPITDDLAATLEQSFDVPASLWINAEKNHQRHLKSGDENND